MTYPDNPNETLIVVGAWKHPTEPNRVATIYRITPSGWPERFESRVYCTGDIVETLTAPTHERLLRMIEQQYSRSEA